MFFYLLSFKTSTSSAQFSHIVHEPKNRVSTSSNHCTGKCLAGSWLFWGMKRALRRERLPKVNPPTEILENRKLEIVICIQAKLIYTKIKRHWKVQVESVNNLNATWESRQSSHVERGREGGRLACARFGNFSILPFGCSASFVVSR